MAKEGVGYLSEERIPHRQIPHWHLLPLLAGCKQACAMIPDITDVLQSSRGIARRQPFAVGECAATRGKHTGILTINICVAAQGRGGIYAIVESRGPRCPLRKSVVRSLAVEIRHIKDTVAGADHSLVGRLNSDR